MTDETKTESKGEPTNGNVQSVLQLKPLPPRVLASANNVTTTTTVVATGIKYQPSTSSNLDYENDDSFGTQDFHSSAIFTAPDSKSNTDKLPHVHDDSDKKSTNSNNIPTKDSPQYLLSIIQSVLPHFQLDIETNPQDPEIINRLAFYSLVSLFIKNFVLSWYHNKIESLNDDFLQNLDKVYIEKMYEFFNKNLQKLDFMKLLLDDIPFIIENLTSMYKHNKKYEYKLRFVNHFTKKINSPLEKTFIESLLNDFILGKMLKNLLDPKVILPILLMSATQKKDSKTKTSKTHNTNSKNNGTNNNHNHENIPIKPQIRTKYLFRRSVTKPSLGSSSKKTNFLNKGHANEYDNDDKRPGSDKLLKEKDDSVDKDGIVTLDMSIIPQDKQSILYRYFFNLVSIKIFRLDERKPLVYGFLKWIQFIAVKYTDFDKILYQYTAEKIYKNFTNSTLLLLKTRHFLFPNDTEILKPDNIEVDLVDLIVDCRTMFSDLSKKYKINLILGINDDDIEDLIKNYLTSSLFLHNICLNSLDCFIASLSS